MSIEKLGYKFPGIRRSIVGGIPTIAIDGGPCAGKTTVLNRLLNLYGSDIIKIMPEVATMLFDGGFPKPGKDLDYSERWAGCFQDSVFPVQRNMEDMFLESATSGPYRLMITDRGLKSCEAYLGLGRDEFLRRFNVDEDWIFSRYTMVIHLESLAVSNPALYEELKATNPSRYETAEEAAWRDQTIKDAWKNHPNFHVISSAHGIDYVFEEVVKLIGRYLHKEIERKFWLPKMPSIDLPPHLPIRQGYLPLLHEMRIRQMADQHYITIKSAGDLEREEWERKIPSHIFDQYWKEITGYPIIKSRRFLPHGGYTAELDDFHAPLDSRGEVLWECEFTSIEEASIFRPGDFLPGSIEVTYDKLYKNRELSRNGWPVGIPIETPFRGIK